MKMYKTLFDTKQIIGKPYERLSWVRWYGLAYNFYTSKRVFYNHISGHPYGRSAGVSTSACVDPGLVRTELGQLFDTHGWV